MIVEFGGVAFLLGFPRRVHPGRFLIGFAAVLVFGLVVMLVVAAGCSTDQVATDPGPVGGSHSAVTGSCEPFCLVRTGAAGVRYDRIGHPGGLPHNHQDHTVL